MNGELILLGGFHEMIELCELCGYRLVGIIDGRLAGEYRSYKFLGCDRDAEKIRHAYPDIPIAISPDLPDTRMKLFADYRKIGFSFRSVISPRALISGTAKLGNGIVIQSGVNVSAQAVIGEGVKLNSLCNVMHDAIIGDFTTIAPNAVILGYVEIGVGSYIGANATILPRKKIGRGAVIGAGAVVTKDVESYTVVVGNPARVLRTREDREGA